jgi:hypothetical protein
VLLSGELPQLARIVGLVGKVEEGKWLKLQLPWLDIIFVIGVLKAGGGKLQKHPFPGAGAAAQALFAGDSGSP